MLSVLIIGSFKHPDNNNHSTTAAEQLAESLTKHNVEVITTTKQYKKFYKLGATIYAIINYSRKYKIAIVPLYGTPMSFIWQSVSVSLLKLLQKKIVIVVHGGSIPQQINEGKTKFIKALNRADVIVCPSAFMQAFLSQKGISSTVIENGLNLSSYPNTQKEFFRPKVIWMRSFSDIYNPEMAVKVAAILVKKYTDFKMIMAGTDGGTLPAIKKMISEYKLESVIILPGYINHNQKIKYAEEFDIYISTNRIDNAPVSVIEFMVLGLPVIAVKTGGIPYIISDNHNGLLVEPEDAEGMADKIEMLIKNPESGKAICRNAYEYTNKYKEENVYPKWLKLFEELNEK